MSKYNLKDIDPKDIRIMPRCLTYEPKSYHKPAAYTADGFMLPCCWLDDPKNDHGVEEKFHLKDEELALKNNDKLEDIYGSKQWEHFFDTLINNPSCALKQCQYKCGNLEKDKYKRSSENQDKIIGVEIRQQNKQGDKFLIIADTLEEIE